MASARCSASKSARYSATLLSWCPIHFWILIGPSSQPSIITPIPDGPGFPREPPSTYATRSDIFGLLLDAGTTMRDQIQPVKTLCRYFSRDCFPVFLLRILFCTPDPQKSRFTAGFEIDIESGRI